MFLGVVKCVFSLMCKVIGSMLTPTAKAKQKKKQTIELVKRESSFSPDKIEYRAQPIKFIFGVRVLLFFIGFDIQLRQVWNLK